jgi:hypothetical protein
VHPESGTNEQSAHDLSQDIVVVRGRRVLLDFSLAAIYGIETRKLNQQVRRNLHRFPSDFLFELSSAEARNLMSQNVISSWGGRRKPPFAFTEHGAIMAATILNSPQAVRMSVYVVRAFIQLRVLVQSNKQLAKQLAALEVSLASLDIDTQRQFREVYEVIRALIDKPRHPARPIGFTADLDKRS